MSRKRIVTVEKVIEAFKDCNSPTEIAEKLCVPINYVYQQACILRKAGYEVKKFVRGVKKAAPVVA